VVRYRGWRADLVDGDASLKVRAVEPVLEEHREGSRFVEARGLYLHGQVVWSISNTAQLPSGRVVGGAVLRRREGKERPDKQGARNIIAQQQKAYGGEGQGGGAGVEGEVDILYEGARSAEGNIEGLR